MLPMLDTRPLVDIKLPESKKVIHIKPYNTAQEKLLLQSLTDETDNGFWLSNIKQVLKQNSQETLDDNISSIDFIYLTLKLRSISKGQTFEYSFKCNGQIESTTEDGLVEINPCKHVFRECDTIDSMINIKNSNVISKVCDVTDTLSVELRAPSIKYFESLSQLKEEISENDDENTLIKRNLELFTNQIAHSVSKVMIKENGKVTVYADFTIEELKENILLNLTALQLQKLFIAKSELINMAIRIRKVCPKCKTVYEKEDTNFFSYLV